MTTFTQEELDRIEAEWRELHEKDFGPAVDALGRMLYLADKNRDEVLAEPDLFWRRVFRALLLPALLSVAALIYAYLRS